MEFLRQAQFQINLFILFYKNNINKYKLIITMGVCNNCNNCLRTENKNSMEADLSSKDFGKIKLFKKI